jgi:hypothetical protein
VKQGVASELIAIPVLFQLGPRDAAQSQQVTGTERRTTKPGAKLLRQLELVEVARSVSFADTHRIKRRGLEVN